MKYIPQPIDMEWAKIMIATLKDGGEVLFPSTQLHYRIDKSQRVLILLNPDMLAENFDSNWVHNLTREVFKTVGYEVIEYYTNTESVSL